ncbi:unnamed protein product [Phytophthora lilii]|uniref:Unnamed protein product n=1 Tax=Phytophthora lilii TaxID=2077276 RepID=A0A9W6T9I1_9STRA|nr:unnamed protein product [Phytophthora lilii]
MSFSWKDLDLGDETLPDATAMPETTTATSLFAEVVMKELGESMKNNQLNKAVQNCNPAAVVPNGEDIGKGGSRTSFAAMVLGALFRAMLDDEPWWRDFGGKSGVGLKRLGYGGVNRFLAETSALRDAISPNKSIDELLSDVTSKMVGIYEQLHPGKKDVRASPEWTQAYTKQCLGAAPTTTR